MQNSIIQNAVLNRLSESLTLDFKEQAYEDKKEWLKDVTAFANASGGKILIGIKEDRDGCAESADGIASDDLDKDIQQLSQWLRDNSDPDVSGAVRITTEFDSEDRKFIIVDIEESANGPHRIDLASAKFGRQVYVRKGRDCVPVSMSEIRDMIEDNQRTPRRIFEFVEERRKSIETLSPIGIPLHQYMVLHACPRRGFGSRKLVDWALRNSSKRFSPHERNWSNLLPNPLGALSKAVNTDDDSYLQLFYNGSVEYVFSRLYYETGESGDIDGKLVVPGPWLKRYINDYFCNALRLMHQALGCEQYEVALRFSGISGIPLHWKTANGWPEESRSAPHEQVFDIPTVVFRTLPNGEIVDQDIKGLMDLIWRAWGELECRL